MLIGRFYHVDLYNVWCVSGVCSEVSKTPVTLPFFSKVQLNISTEKPAVFSH